MPMNDDDKTRRSNVTMDSPDKLAFQSYGQRMPGERERLERRIKRAKESIAKALQEPPREICAGPEADGCACTGHCLQHLMAQLRFLAEVASGEQGPQVWCDQLHGTLRWRGDGDSMNITPDKV